MAGVGEFKCDPDILAQTVPSLNAIFPTINSMLDQVGVGASTIAGARGAGKLSTVANISKISTSAEGLWEDIETLKTEIATTIEKAYAYSTEEVEPTGFWATGLGKVLATGAVFTGSVVKGVAQVLEGIVDTGAMIAGKAYSVFASEEKGEAFKEKMANFVATSYTDKAWDKFYTQTEFGRNLNASSFMEYDGKAANCVAGVTKWVGIAALSAIPGGGPMIAAAVAGTSGMGSQAQRSLNEGKDFDTAFKEGAKRGAIDAVSAYALGKGINVLRSAKAAAAIGTLPVSGATGTAAATGSTVGLLPAAGGTTGAAGTVAGLLPAAGGTTGAAGTVAGLLPAAGGTTGAAAASAAGAATAGGTAGAILLPAAGSSGAAILPTAAAAASGAGAAAAGGTAATVGTALAPIAGTALAPITGTALAPVAGTAGTALAPVAAAGGATVTGTTIAGGSGILGTIGQAATTFAMNHPKIAAAIPGAFVLGKGIQEGLENTQMHQNELARNQANVKSMLNEDTPEFKTFEMPEINKEDSSIDPIPDPEPDPTPPSPSPDPTPPSPSPSPRPSGGNNDNGGGSTPVTPTPVTPEPVEPEPVEPEPVEP